MAYGGQPERWRSSQHQQPQPQQRPLAWWALGIADRAYVLVEGRNRLAGSAGDLLANPSVGQIFLGKR